MYLISAYFDDESNRILQGYIDDIAETSGNSFMTANHVPPHITLSAIEARSVEVLIPAFMELEGKLQSSQVDFVTVGEIVPKVIYVAPYLNDYLMTMSEEIYRTFSDIPETSVSKFYRPLSWLPHVTLGKTLDRPQILKALEVMQDFKPFSGEITRIGLAKVNPHEDVKQILL